MNKLSIKDLDVDAKRVLMRVDFNVPQNNDGSVRDDTRIRAALKSIEFVRDNGGRLVLMSHLGRPVDVAKADDPNLARRKNAALKLDPIADALRGLTRARVTKVDDVGGAQSVEAVEVMAPADIVLLENTRFHPGETKNDPELAKRLASLGDVFVNEAFGTAHRAHASTEGVTHHFEHRAAGFLLHDEIEYFNRILNAPERPFVAILGGAKVSGKIEVIDNLLGLVDTLIIGGGMCFTFMKALGYEIGESLLDESGIETAKSAIENAKKMGVKLLLPTDAVVADAFSADAKVKTVAIGDIEPGWIGMDVGPASVASFTDCLANAKTVVWNGPLGVFEMEPFSYATKAIALKLAELPLISVIGGGDTAAAVAHFQVAHKMSHVSTGGGASLEMLEGKELPGLAALSDA